MERETKIITTPNAHAVEIKTYLTGREKRALTNIYIQTNLDFNSETKQIKGIDAALIDKAQELAWKTLIVSIDGKKEGEISLVDTILDMRSDDYDFIVSEVNRITADKSFEQKKTI